MQLSGHSAIISGGASGLGRATAALLASRGMRVLIADLQEEAGRATAAEIGCQFMRCDVTQASDVEAAVQAANALAPLRVAVSCAGIAPAAARWASKAPMPWSFSSA
jgi:Short-chain dehydrogenase involved in D-alanine esterification of lipoteichoic acid and wall teichoic acid (D-alanine transfer protein)